MKLSRGDSVVYIPYEGCPPEEHQRGIVKSVSPDGESAFVLYHTKAMTYTEDDLDNYVAANTKLSDLRLDQ